MKHLALGSFWEKFHKLPKDIQTKAKKCFKILKQDERHPSLHFKKLKLDDIVWSVRVDQNYRALAFEDKNNIVWFWIGTHTEYDKMIK